MYIRSNKEHNSQPAIMPDKQSITGASSKFPKPLDFHPSYGTAGFRAEAAVLPSTFFRFVKNLIFVHRGLPTAVKFKDVTTDAPWCSGVGPSWLEGL